MIRGALIALGLSASGLGAGASTAQNLTPAAPLLETCGGTRLVLDAVLLDDAMDDAEAWDRAADVVNARIGGLHGDDFDYTEVTGDQMTVSLPEPIVADTNAIAPLLENVGLGLYPIDRFAKADSDLALAQGEFALPTLDMPDQVAVMPMTPIVSGADIAQAAPMLDQNNQPAISFTFTTDGTQAFGAYTRDNIGNAIAIVLRDEVVSAPRIMSAILGGQGMISGHFTVDETKAIANVLNSGVMPFELTIVAQDTLDGSDPSADFCP